MKRVLMILLGTALVASFGIQASAGQGTAGKPVESINAPMSNAPVKGEITK